ncbi:hypothetical protein [Vibrio owensii]|uniref:hypothetical protein n=1 Tax=Vibrio owensii TaxID=696485 RepID=UPI002FEF0E13
MSGDFFEKIAADKSQLGFDYQDLVCLEYLIDMRQGESVGLEVLDDVHHERIHGDNVLIQVKHSVNESESLTNRDLDLWKTLYNWAEALQHLQGKEVQFVFFTNKKKTTKQGLVDQLDRPKIIVSDIAALISSIKEDIDRKESEKEKEARENPIKKYVDYVNNLTLQQKKDLFEKIKFVFSGVDIFNRLKAKVEYFSIDKNNSNDAVCQLIGVYNKKKYELIKNDKKIIIDYDRFRNEFQFDRTIKLFQDRKLDFSGYYRFKNANNIDPKYGIFSKQLKDIGIGQDDITDYAIEYAATSMYIQKLISEGDFSDAEDEVVNGELHTSWRTLHRESYNNNQIINEDEHTVVARSCLYKFESINAIVSDTKVVQPMVIGKGMELSDKCQIGWRRDWKDIYGES